MKNMKINSLIAREIFDSRGQPTIEVDLYINDCLGRASIPSGASTGTHEASELRDNDTNRFNGKGVLNAINNVNGTIANNIRGKIFKTQLELDNLLISLDGSDNKSILGANAILGVSIAFAKAMASVQNIELYQYIMSISGIKNNPSLPMPMMNFINGGAHADSKIAIQEFMLIPIGATNFQAAMQMGGEIYINLKNILKTQNLGANIGDEGGFAPRIDCAKRIFDLLLQAGKNAGYKPYQDFAFALDVAANEFYDQPSKLYHLAIGQSQEKLSNNELINYYQELESQYPIYSIEDGLAEDDWQGWQLMSKKIGNKCQLVGDDLFATNLIRLQKGINKNIANAIIIKMNQVGTLSETLACIKLAQDNHYQCIISHRSGETEDTTIAHIALGTGATQIKTGGFSRSERMCKYNELLRIGEKLSNKYNIEKLANY